MELHADASTLETEEFGVNLPEVLILKLQIDPDGMTRRQLLPWNLLGLS